MSLDYFLLPKTFTKIFLNKLSSDSFCALLKFYKFYCKYGDKVSSLSSKLFNYYILISDNKEKNEAIWGELDENNLVKRDYKTGIYELNLEKIEKKEQEPYKLRLVAKIRRKRINDPMKEFIDGVLIKYPNERIKNKVHKLILGHIKYLSNKKREIKILYLKNLMDPLIIESEEIVEKTCDIYNRKYHGTKSAGYIHGILGNVKIEMQDKSKTFKKENLKEFRNKKVEVDNEFALKLATEDMSENESYKAYIKLGEIEELKELYKLGVELANQKNIKTVKYDCLRV